jgi:hypothetical protein
MTSLMARIGQLSNAVRALAPEEDWGWVIRASERLRAKAVPARDKRIRMRPAQEGQK